MDGERTQGYKDLDAPCIARIDKNINIAYMISLDLKERPVFIKTQLTTL